VIRLVKEVFNTRGDATNVRDWISQDIKGPDDLVNLCDSLLFVMLALSKKKKEKEEN